MNFRDVLYAFGLCAVTAVSVAAQARPALDELVTAYERGDYQRAAAVAESAAVDSASIARDDRAYFLTYWAFSLVALSRDDEAVRIFRSLLALNPATDLNPEFVSPKIIVVFRRAKAEFTQPAAPPASGGKLLVDARRPTKPAALIRTLAWPGWGQSYRGQPKKGRIFKIASLAAAVGLGAAQIGSYFAHKDYLDARDAGRIDDTYALYNRWYRIRNLSLNVAVSVWVFGAVDVMMGD